MAVIITDMDMPKSCWDCSMFKLGTYRKLHHCNVLDRDMYFDNGEAKRFRLNDCPLKSADEMIKEIEQLERFELRGETTPLVNVNRVMEIIHKYTDKEIK